MNEELKRLASALNSARSGTKPRDSLGGGPLKCSLMIHARNHSDLLIPILCEPEINAALQALLLQMVNHEILSSEEQIVAAETVVDRAMNDNDGWLRQQIRRLEETDEDTK